jgi:hypothetical protein
MRMTAIHAQTERKRQDRSARCAEKHRCRDRTRRFRGLIRSVSAACATAGAAQGGSDREDDMVDFDSIETDQQAYAVGSGPIDLLEAAAAA